MNALEEKPGLGQSSDNNSTAVETIPQGPAQRPHETPSPNRPIRVLVVDGHPVACPGITACLAKLPHITTVTYAAEGHDALCKARTLRPDIVVTGLEEPGMSGLKAIEVLLRENPGVKVLILSVGRHVEIVLRSLEPGARGYVLKNAPADELLRAIETVHGGQVFFREDIEPAAINRVARQREQGPQPKRHGIPERDLEVAFSEGLGRTRSKLN